MTALYDDLREVTVLTLSFHMLFNCVLPKADENTVSATVSLMFVTLFGHGTSVFLCFTHHPAGVYMDCLHGCVKYTKSLQELYEVSMPIFQTFIFY